MKWLEYSISSSLKTKSNVFFFCRKERKRSDINVKKTRKLKERKIRDLYRYPR